MEFVPEQTWAHLLELNKIIKLDGDPVLHQTTRNCALQLCSWLCISSMTVGCAYPVCKCLRNSTSPLALTQK